MGDFPIIAISSFVNVPSMADSADFDSCRRLDKNHTPVAAIASQHAGSRHWLTQFSRGLHCIMQRLGIEIEAVRPRESRAVLGEGAGEKKPIRATV
jgi:hypothetical protein